MNMNKIMDDFVSEYLKGNPLASKDEIMKLVLDVNKILENNKDATPEEIINLIISDIVNKVESKKEGHLFNDYAVGLRTKKTNVGIYSKADMKDRLFDCNSMAMAVGDGVILKYVNEGLLSYSDRIKDLDPRFENLNDDLTLGDVAFYKVKLFTDGNLANAQNKDEAEYKLFTMTGERIDNYRYSDLNLPVMIKVIEKVTGKEYADLAEDYIKNDLKLNNMHVVVPENKIHLVTNTPNAKYGKCNDLKSILLDPVKGAGGAGSLFATSEDLKTYMMNLKSFVPRIMEKEFAYVQEEGGVWDSTYVDELEQDDTVALHGRYATEAIGNERGAHNVLLDVAGVPLEVAKAKEEEMNREFVKNGENPKKVITNLDFYHDGRRYRYDFNDSRMYIPFDDCVTEEIINENSKALLKIKFLEKVIESYDKNYLDKGLNVERVGRGR